MSVNPVPTLGWRRETVAATILQVTQDQRDQMAARARKLMEEQHYTNASLAYEAKVSEKTVSRLINASREPRYATLERIATALNVSVEELTGPPPAPLGLTAPPRVSVEEDVLTQLLSLVSGLDEQVRLLRTELAERDVAMQRRLDEGFGTS